MKEWLRSNEKTVYRVVNAGILAGMVLLGGQGFLGTGEPGRAHLIAALVVLAVSAVLNFMAARGRVLGLAALSVFLLTGAALAGMEDSIRFLGSFFLWLSGSGTVSETWSLWYGVVQAGLLAEMCYMMQILFEKIPALKTAAGILALLALGFCLLAGKEMNHYGVAFLLVFCVIAWVEWIQDHWKKEHSLRGSREAHTLWIMPFLAFYLVLLAVMPVPEKPYDWLWAKNIYRQLRESFLTYTQNIKWGSREGFSMAFGGFSDSGELGGDLQEEAGPVMQIKVNRDTFRNASAGFDGNIVGNLYLTGNVYDTFDGRGWHQDWQGYSGEAFLDTAETLYAVRTYNERYQRDYLREVSLEIRYEDFHTGYVFAPLKVWSVEGEALPDYTNAGGSLRWIGQQGYGTEYVLRYFRMNAGQQEFDLFLEAAGNNAGSWESETVPGGGVKESEIIRENDADSREKGEAWEFKGNQGKSEEIWAEIQKECRRRNGEIVSWDDIMRYRKEIYETYLGDVVLSPEGSRYLQEVTENTETDVEKLRAIERALQSFSYTLIPGELPGWVEEAGDFLDYFLLESRQGYCTYFATAFVLLARAEGIPARYVQGYCVPVPESGEAYVDSTMAHAWPEAYLDGVGWVPFEPTPGYGDRRYSPWGLEQPEPGNMVSEQDSSLFSDYGAGGEGEPAGDVMNTEEVAENHGMETEEDRENSFYLWMLLGRGIPLLLMVCAVVLAIDRAISRYRYKKMDSCERFRMAVFRNLEILSRLGVKKREGETLQELRERAELLPGLSGKEVEEVLTAAERTGILCFIEDYERVVYGGKEAGEDMLEGAVQAGEMLLRLLKKEKKWAYFCCRMELFFGRYR